MPGNLNGKISQHVYIDSILEKVIKPWLKADDDFVLEKNSDLGHKLGKIIIS